MAEKHLARFRQLVPADYLFDFGGELCAVAIALSISKSDCEAIACARNVSRIYEYDCRLLYLEGDGVD